MNDETPYMLNLEMIQEYVSSLKTLLSRSSFIEQKSFLRSFVKRIELNEPRIVIDYAMPIPVNGLTTIEEVLRIDKSGSRGRIRTFDMAVNSRPLYRLSYSGRLNAILNIIAFSCFEVKAKPLWC